MVIQHLRPIVQQRLLHYMFFYLSLAFFFVAFTHNVEAIKTGELFLINPENCTVTPKPKVNSNTPSYFSVTCPPGITSASLEFLTSQEPDGQVVTQGAAFPGAVIAKMDISRAQTLTDLQYCRNQTDSKSCSPFQVRIDFSNFEKPIIDSIDVLGVPLEQPVFDPESDVYRVKVFRNVLTTFAVRSNYKNQIFVGGLNTTLIPNFVESTFVFKRRVDTGPETVMLYAATRDASIIRAYKLVIDAVPSEESRLSSLSISPGRLDPPFNPEVYSYYARVPPGRTRYSLYLEGLDSKNTKCSIKGQQSDNQFESSVTGQGYITLYTPVLQAGNAYSALIECTAEDETRSVRYVLVLVPQLGGSTLLHDLSVIGASMDSAFDEQNHGPYNVYLDKHIRNKAGWIAFVAHTVNPRAFITVDGHQIDSTTDRSPWFKIQIGTKREFRIGVRTPENPIEEIYFVEVTRPGKAGSLQAATSLSKWIAGLSTIISADSAASFLQNFRFLQFMSLTGRIHQTGEIYEAFSHGFNPWNLQFNAYGIAHKKQPLHSHDAQHIMNATATIDSEMGDSTQRLNMQFLDSQYQQLPLKQAVDSTVASMAAKFFDSDEITDTYQNKNSNLALVAKAGSTLQSQSNFNRIREKVAEALLKKYMANVQYDGEKAKSFFLSKKFFVQENNDQHIAESRRRLTATLSDVEELRILEIANAEAATEQALADYMTSIVFTTLLLLLIGGAYFIAVTCVVQLGIKGNKNQIRDMPVVLHPIRFWTFVFDIVLMAYGQACLGIIACPSELRSTQFIVLGFIPSSPWAMMWFAAFIMLLFPIAYLSAIGWAFFSMKKLVVFSNELSCYHKRNIYVAKAESKIVPWLPIISNLLALELREVAPIYAADDDFEDDENVERAPIQFEEDTVSGGPCALSPPISLPNVEEAEGENAVANSQTQELKYSMLNENTVSSRRIHYHPDSDELKVSLGGLRGSYMYDSSNTPVYDKYPNALVGRKTFSLLNPYSFGMSCRVNVQLKHLSNLWQMSELPHHFHFWIKQNNCHMDELDGWNALFRYSQRGNYFYYVIDRVVYFLLMGGVVIGQESQGIITSWLLASACLLTAAAYIPPAILSGTSKWHALKVNGIREQKKEAAFNKLEKVRESKWPYTKNEVYRQRVDQIQAQKEAMDACGHGGWFSRHPLLTIDEWSWWDWRLWLCVREVLFGAAGIELIKFFILFSIALGNASKGSVSSTSAANSAMFFCFTGIILVNWESLLGVISQFKTLYDATYRACRNFVILMSDLFQDLPHFGPRLLHLCQTCYQRIIGNKSASYDFPSSSGEALRQFKVTHCELIADEVGIHFHGAIKPDDATLRLSKKIANRHIERYALYKTVHKSGPIGAHRSNLDDTMPIRLAFRDFYLGKMAMKRGAAATVQIVNHGFRSTLQPFQKNVFSKEDDSYLTLYRDPRYMPEWGVLKPNPMGHGYVVHYDRQAQTLVFRGPGIKANTRYVVKSEPSLNQDEDDLSDLESEGELETGRTSDAITADANNPEELSTAKTTGTHQTDKKERSSKPKQSSGSYETSSTCLIPGLLYVSVPKECAPSLLQPIEIEPTNKELSPFVIDPHELKVYFDETSSELILRHRLFFEGQMENNEYLVRWIIAGNERLINEVAICEEQGILYVPLSDPAVPDLKTMITLTDDQTSKPIFVNPRDTDAHRVGLFPTKELHGPNLVLSRMLGMLKGCENQVYGSHKSLRDTVEEYLPCTIVQCVNPSLGYYRVEPNFRDVGCIMRAKTHTLEAQRHSLQTSGRIMWESVMSQKSTEEFWREHGVQTVPSQGIWLDPLDNEDHPLMKSQQSKIEKAIPSLLAIVDRLLEQRIKSNEKALDDITCWVRAYDDPGLYAAQLDKDAVEIEGTAEALASHVEKVKCLKASYENIVPGFFYPFVVEECLISKMPNIAAQLRQWNLQLGVWLRTEEDALVYSSAGERASPRSATSYSSKSIKHESTDPFSLQKVLANIMRSLKANINEGENLEHGLYRSALHYVVDSINVRGPYINWRPDPIGAHLALVRIWYPDSEGNPDFSRDPVWNPCCLKLSATAIKILLPGKDDVDFRFRTPYYWSHVLGHTVQLDCLESLEVTRETSLPAGHTSNAMLRGMPAQLVCRLTSILKHVNDKHIALVESGVSGREILMKHDGGNDDEPSANQSDNGESFVISLGRRVPVAEASDFPQNEVRIANDQAQIYPLTFRFAERFFDKWIAVVEEAQMNRPPIDIDTNFGLDEQEQLHIKEMIAPTALEAKAKQEEKCDDYTAEYSGQWQNFQYHGIGELRNSDGVVVYKGEWRNGYRWGYGECDVVDKRGYQWRYKGQFVKDEFCGEGELTLIDPQELKRLSQHPLPEDRQKIVHYKGRFASDVNKPLETEPLETTRPNVDPELLKELFETDPAYNLSDTPLVIDIRRAISAHIQPIDAANMGSTVEETADVIRQEYLPHKTRWCRSLDRRLEGSIPASASNVTASAASPLPLAHCLTEGVVHFADGSVFEGGLLQGLPNGQGSYMSANGRVKCTGTFLEGNPDGYATVLEIKNDATESVYQGYFKNGLRHGSGIQTSNNGRSYVKAEWVNDRIGDGSAVIFDTDVSHITDGTKRLRRYVGPVKHGLPEGEGKLIWNDNVTYKGQFLSGKRHGAGIVRSSPNTDESTVLVSGLWNNDAPHGRVTKMVLADNRIYSGEIVNGVCHGMGELFVNDKGKLLYEGFWEADKPNNRGVLYSKDGTYDGEFRGGVRHGKGTFEFTKSDKSTTQRSYVGNWKDDLPDGVGLYTNEKGVGNTYKFSKGKLDKNSVTAYKSGMCGKAPDVGAEPSISSYRIAPARVTTYGSERKLTPTAYLELCGPDVEDCLWPRLTHYTAYMDPSCAPVRPMPVEAKVPSTRRTDEILPQVVQKPRLLCLTVVRAEGLTPCPHTDVWIAGALGQNVQNTPTVPNEPTACYNCPIHYRLDAPDHLMMLEIWEERRLTGQKCLASVGQLSIKEFLASKNRSSGEMNVALSHVEDPSRVASVIVQLSIIERYDAQTTKSNTGSGEIQHSPTLKQTLCVTLGAAKDLPNMDVGKKMDPYAIVTLGKHKVTSKVHAMAGSNFTFDEEFNFPIDTETHFSIELYDKDVLSKDDFIGGANVNISSPTFSETVKLTRPDKHKGEIAAGMLNVTYRIEEAYPTAPEYTEETKKTHSNDKAPRTPNDEKVENEAENFQKADHTEEQTLATMQDPHSSNHAEAAAKSPSITNNTEEQPHHEPLVNGEEVQNDTEKHNESDTTEQTKKTAVVRIKLGSARDLPNMDIGKKMDPYVVAILGEHKATSKVHKQAGSNPIFNEELTLPYNKEKELLIELYDKDIITKDDFIGRAIIDLTPSTYAGTLRLVRPAKDKPTTDVPAGVLEIIVDVIEQ